MRRFLVGSCVALVLAGCGGGSTVARLQLQLSAEGAKRSTEITEAVQRMVESRLAALDEKGSITVETQDGKPVLVMTVDNDVVAEKLTSDLQVPLDFRLMKAVPNGQEAEVVVDKFGGFVSTGVNTTSILWATPSETKDGKGFISIMLTPAGQAELKKVFAENRGNQIAVFVRERLMSVKTVTVNDNKDTIDIDSIPSAAIAKIFADDVNVGAHVTFQSVAASGTSSSK